MELIEETLFASLDRRQLLAASRDINDRALRVGSGGLRVGSQRLSAFESQVPVYRRLGTETDLDVHVYGRPDWSPPAIENVTYHRDDDGSFDRYWFLAFDGGGDDTQTCALVARDRTEGCTEFPSYDPDLVGEMPETVGAATE